MSLELILSRLEYVKQSGQDRYMARCPVHAEKRSSLLVTPKADGKITAYCFGCGAGGPDVVKAIGLTLDVLFPPRETFRDRRGAGNESGASTAFVRPLRRFIDEATWHMVFVSALDWDLCGTSVQILRSAANERQKKPTHEIPKWAQKALAGDRMRA